MIPPAELQTLLRDALKLWNTPAQVTTTETALQIQTPTTTLTIRPGPPPTSWFLTTASRTRPHPSIPALLTAIRHALNIPPGTKARIGPGATPL